MFKMILSSLLIICIIYPPYISTASVNSPFRFITGLNPSNPRPLHLNPAPDPGSQSNTEAAAAASTIQPTVPSSIPATDAVSSPADATASSPPGSIPNNTVLENPALLEEVTEFTLLDEDNAVLANDTSMTVEYSTYCWSAQQIFSIQNPQDCDDALKEIMLEGQATTPVTWSGPRSWTAGSCALLLVPERPSPEDVFVRLDIVLAVTTIVEQCVNGEHGYRGGHRGVGPLKQFHVSVEASM